MHDLSSSIIYIATGMVVTLQYTLAALGGGLLLGLVLTLLRRSAYRFVQWLVTFYVSIFRGTPLLVQLSLVYLALPHLIHVTISPFTAGVIAFSLNSAAYITEIIRAGIDAVDIGQFEAGQTLGIPKRLLYQDIILPQALRNILPALMNEMTSLLKETAIISMIGEADIMRRAQLVAAEQYTYFQPLCIAALCYYILVTGLNLLATFIEKKVRYDHR